MIGEGSLKVLPSLAPVGPSSGQGKQELRYQLQQAGIDARRCLPSRARY